MDFLGTFPKLSGQKYTTSVILSNKSNTLFSKLFRHSAIQILVVTVENIYELWKTLKQEDFYLQPTEIPHLIKFFKKQKWH